MEKYPKAFDDTFFLEKFRELVAEYGIKTVVETGTWLGDSIIEIAKFANRAISIEINPDFFKQVKARLAQEGYSQISVPGYLSLKEGIDAASYVRGEGEVTLIRGNSPDVIRMIIEHLPEPILFFLDAHWLEYWPIKDEIRAIKPRSESIIIIHDFKVPGKPWHYEHYESECNGVEVDTELDYNFVKEELAYVNSKYLIFYNEESAAVCRGILYAVPAKSKMELSIVYVTCHPGGFDILADSLRNQTFKDYELIIIDDHPLDRRDLVKSYLEGQGIPVAYMGSCKPKCFPEIAYNMSNAFNTGFLLSTKEVVILLEDYLWLPPDCLEKIAKRADLLAENYCIVLPGQRWANYELRDNQGLISIWEQPWKGSPKKRCGKSFVWVPAAWEFACIAFPWNVIAEANGWPESLDSYAAMPYEPLVRRFEAAGGKPYVDKDNFMHIINHSLWEPSEIWLASSRKPTGSTIYIERENCFDLKTHIRGKAYWLEEAKAPNIFEKPEYWCGNLGYRPGPDGIGYRDFPIHQVKVDYILSRRPRGKVLDIGCAFGYTVKRLRDRGIDAWGVDISRYALGQAPDEVKPYLKLASADKLPFRDKEFDIAFSASTFEHLPAEILPKAISEAVRVAERGIIAVTPGDDPHFSQDITHQTKQPLPWWRSQFPPQFEIRSDADEWPLKKIPEVQIHRMEWIRSKATLQDKILEVGCAENPVWAGTKFNVVTLDSQINPDLQISPDVVGEAEELPFEDNSFDIICEGELLEHVADPQRVLKEAVRVAKNKVIITVPYEHLWSPELKPFLNPGHVRFYTPETLNEEIEALALPFQIEVIRHGLWVWLGAEIHCGGKALSKKVGLQSRMEWASYHSLAESAYFLLSKELFEMEMGLEKERCDSLHTTRRFEYPWVYLSLQPFSKDDIILEAGAADTVFQLFLSKMVKEVHSLDINPDFVNWVSKRGFSNVFSTLGDLTNMKFPSSYFDKTICISTLEHLAKERVVDGIEELIRVTKPGGKIAITMDIVLEKTDKQTDWGDFRNIADKYSLAIPESPRDMMISRVPPYNFPFTVAGILLKKEAK